MRVFYIYHSIYRTHLPHSNHHTKIIPKSIELRNISNVINMYLYIPYIRVWYGTMVPTWYHVVPRREVLVTTIQHQNLSFKEPRTRVCFYFLIVLYVNGALHLSRVSSFSQQSIKVVEQGFNFGQRLECFISQFARHSLFS